MNKAKAQAKLPTLTNEELATLASMVADEQQKRRIKPSNRRDYTLHHNKRQFIPKAAQDVTDSVSKWLEEKKQQKSAFTPHQESLKNGAVREFVKAREGREPPFLSPEHFEQIFNKHHPGGSMMEDDWCGDGEY